LSKTLHLPVGDEAVRRFFDKSKVYTYKKKIFARKKNRIVPDVQRKTQSVDRNYIWCKCRASKYISMKSGIKYKSHKTLCTCSTWENVPWMLPRSNTPAGNNCFCQSIRLNGSLVYTTYQGGTTAQRFREYIGKQLIPSLEKGDVVSWITCVLIMPK